MPHNQFIFLRLFKFVVLGIILHCNNFPVPDSTGHVGERTIFFPDEK